MSSGIEFEILPIEGREEAQKFAAKLPTKAEKFNSKKISLNERFGILELGYYLNPAKIENTQEDYVVGIYVTGKEVLTKKQFVQKQKLIDAATAAANAKKLSEKKIIFDENDKENSLHPSPKKQTELEPTDKLTPDAYFNEIQHKFAQSRN